jgi:protein-S-isoprenylcysteine O-methyltransferase Ste14
MVAVTALSLVFAWWARIYLGRLWSGSITRKEGHHVVDTGPYRFVRHPIYTGIIFAAFATAIVMSTPRVYIGATFVLVGYWMKARIEERFLRTELGADAYDAYAHKTAMLVPFVKF